MQGLCYVLRVHGVVFALFSVIAGCTRSQK